jgi:hypothetical protein
VKEFLLSTLPPRECDSRRGRQRYRWKRKRTLAEKWFGPIEPGERYERNLPVGPAPIRRANWKYSADVPLDALYKCWHIYPRLDQRYYVVRPHYRGS